MKLQSHFVRQRRKKGKGEHFRMFILVQQGVAEDISLCNAKTKVTFHVGGLKGKGAFLGKKTSLKLHWF